MKKKSTAFIILFLVFIFPFRWAFLEYPANINVRGTMIDGGRIEYVLYFVLTIIGFLTFLFMSTSESGEAKHE